MQIFGTTIRWRRATRALARWSAYQQRRYERWWLKLKAVQREVVVRAAASLSGAD
jgi:hypothetical protein